MKVVDSEKAIALLEKAKKLLRGECYEGGCTGSENIAFSAAISVCLGVPSKDPQAPCMTEVHSCKDGSIGVADFQGFQKVEKK